MSFSGSRSKKTITIDMQHAHDEQADKEISTPPKPRYATRSATKSENPATNKNGDRRNSSPGELSQISKHLKSKSWNLKSKNSTSPCELSQASDCLCAGTSRNTTTKKTRTVQASLPGSPGRVSKDQHKGQDAAPEKCVTPKKKIVSASSQKSRQLSLFHHSKKTEDLKAEDQSSTMPCCSSQTSQFLEDQHTTKDPKLGNKTTSSAQEPSQPSKDHRPQKTQYNGNLKKSEISIPSSKPSEIQHALGSKYFESEKIVINTRSPSKSIQPSKRQPAMKISEDSTPKYKDKESRAQYFITWNGFEEPEPEPCGLNCYLCAEDLACSPNEDNNDGALLPEVAVLACGHAFHSICLSLQTSEEQYWHSREPECLACLGFFS